MGLFGGDDKKEEVKTCPNCGKELKPGEGIRKENGHFCCDKCCEVGPRIEEKKKQGKPLTCEFC
ncbi:MAG: hypothetical protein WD231_05255 [Candidatus Woykebacteria bacterium]